MACNSDLSVVLLPIRPRYASFIMDGRKKVEFRKTVFSSHPEFVVVYASSPVQRVLGYFRVSAVEVASVDSLWEDYAHVGCIGRDDFAAYYGDRDTGVVLRIGEVVALSEPMALADLGLNPRPPQSYSYAHAAVVDLIDRYIHDHPLVPVVEARLRSECRLRLEAAFTQGRGRFNRGRPALAPGVAT